MIYFSSFNPVGCTVSFDNLYSIEGKVGKYIDRYLHKVLTLFAGIKGYSNRTRGGPSLRTFKIQESSRAAEVSDCPT